jgi:hypothetical protein
MTMTRSVLAGAIALFIAAQIPVAAAQAQTTSTSGSTLLETITVPIDSSSVTSRTTLADGVAYRLRASGTFRIGGPGDGMGDAEYANFANPTMPGADICGPPLPRSDLGIGIDAPDVGSTTKLPFWGKFAPDHVYTIDFVGRGAPIHVNYHDCSFDDNSGSLTLQIFRSGAQGNLPAHPKIVSFNPQGQDFLETQFTDIGFGEAIAIRNGFGFIGIPRARDNGHVAVLNLTATGWKRIATLKAPNPSVETEFGRSLTFRDGVLVVGASNAAYVFKRSGTAFNFAQTLRPPAADDVADFPVALRYEGGTLLASGFRNEAPGVVYVFELSSTGTFVRRATVKASDSTGPDSFGSDISMTSRMFVVGAAAAAYTFQRNSSGKWIQVQKLLPLEPARGFGTAVAIDNDMILIGAPEADVEGLPSGPDTSDGHVAGGAVYGFLPRDGRYLESFKLRPRPDERFAYVGFGAHIAMFGSRIAIAAAEPNSGVSQFQSGFVFTYTRDGSSVLARGVADGQLEIIAVGLANNWLLVGAQADATCPLGCSGRALIYDVNRFAQ